MPVYVDNARRPFGRLKMCHMIADTSDELLDMARAIGLRVKWLQYAGTHREHFDVSLSRRKRAIDRGAIEISSIDLVKIQIRKREAVTC